ncbi:aldehyde dehydrogenase family protein [Pseudomonas sp. BGr12]|uniref:aldehyde dehydrogenase family protein n=1 Tax=Pseudomonas sp. BGr12 TaxID=2936269 RepID=UPI002559E836|nr:aldehyde dehydrogenase family protein [Pseudomonas sp. BJa5]MDL2428410.1 aldehyde dehydrogenase family protein [Pseudomonas sp. BJa5]
MTMIKVNAPFDGQLIAEIQANTDIQIEQALAKAHYLFRNRKTWLKKSVRIEILRKAATLIAARREGLAKTVAQESGKPYKDALIEVDRGLDCLHICIEEIRTKAGNVIPMDLNATSAGRIAFTQHEPIGVVVGVSAFNHPFNLVVHQAAPALAVGAPVIIKPAPKTPLSAFAFMNILYEAGLPQEWAQIVLPATNEQTVKLISDPRVGFFSFIGSAAVGWMLRSKLAPGTRCALEHGGIAPVIVAGDADLDMALPRLARGGFWHAGQACVSVQRVFADRKIARQVAEGLAAHAEKLVIGDPLLPTTDVGPIITHAENDRIHQWVATAVRDGAEVICGGKRLSDSTYACTVLLDPPKDADVSRKEIFGPVICVYSFDDVDSAIEEANSTAFSFQAAVFTQSVDTALHCYRNLDGTAVMVNENTLFRVDWMPFAGARHSGHGVGGIPHTMHEMQIEKMMVWRSDVLN